MKNIKIVNFESNISDIEKRENDPNNHQGNDNESNEKYTYAFHVKNYTKSNY